MGMRKSQAPSWWKPVEGYQQVDLALKHIKIYLVGGFKHLEKYEFVNGKDYPYIMENKKCLKPPTRWSS
jgi:hypothetical protein